MRLIDAEKLFEKTAEWEAHALEYVGKLNEQEGDETPSLEWRRWTAILGERSAFKHDIMDAPTVDAVPVVRCKDCTWQSETISGIRGGNCNQLWCVYFNTWVPMDHYCSKGERKDTQ